MTRIVNYSSIKNLDLCAQSLFLNGILNKKNSQSGSVKKTSHETNITKYYFVKSIDFVKTIGSFSC